MSPVASTRRGREPQLRKNIARPQLSLPLSAGQDCLRLAPQSAQVRFAPGIYVSAPGRRTNSYTGYGFIEVNPLENCRVDRQHNMACKFLRRSSSRFSRQWQEVSWIPLASMPTHLAGEHFRATERSNTLISHSRRLFFIVDGANAVDSFVVRSTETLNMVAPSDSTTWRANSCRCQRHTSGRQLVRGHTNVCLFWLFLVFGAAISSSLQSSAAARSADASWACRLSIIRSAGVSPSKVICAIHSSKSARAGVRAL